MLSRTTVRISGSREIVQWSSSLLFGRTWAHIKMSGVVACTCNPNTGHCSAILANLVHSSQWGTLSQKNYLLFLKMTPSFSLPSTCMCTYSHMHLITQEQTHRYNQKDISIYWICPHARKNWWQCIPSPPYHLPQNFLPSFPLSLPPSVCTPHFHFLHLLPPPFLQVIGVTMINSQALY